MAAEYTWTPDYILDNFTDELFADWWQARNSRVIETDRALRPKEQESNTGNKRVSDVELLAFMKKRELLPHEFNKWLN